MREEQSRILNGKFHCDQSACIECGRCPFDGVLPRPFPGAATGPENVFIGGRREQRARRGNAE